MTDFYISIDGKEKRVYTSCNSFLESTLDSKIIVRAYIKEIYSDNTSLVLSLPINSSDRFSYGSLSVLLDDKVDLVKLRTMLKLNQPGVFLIYITLGYIGLEAILDETKREVITPDFVEKGQVWRYNALNPFLISATSLPPAYKNVIVRHVEDNHVHYSHENHPHKIEKTLMKRFLEVAEFVSHGTEQQLDKAPETISRDLFDLVWDEFKRLPSLFETAIHDTVATDSSQESTRKSVLSNRQNTIREIILHVKAQLEEE